LPTGDAASRIFGYHKIRFLGFQRASLLGFAHCDIVGILCSVDVAAGYTIGQILPVRVWVAQILPIVGIVCRGIGPEIFSWDGDAPLPAGLQTGVFKKRAGRGCPIRSGFVGLEVGSGAWGVLLVEGFTSSSKNWKTPRRSPADTHYQYSECVWQESVRSCSLRINTTIAVCLAYQCFLC